MTQYIRVVADTNDADYIETFKPITDEELAYIMPVIEAIKGFQPYQGEWCPGKFITYSNNWPTGEYCRLDMGEKTTEQIYTHVDQEALGIFEEEYAPHDEYGIHTIESITIMQITDQRELL